MKNFEVAITETLKKIVTVEAETLDEAEWLAEAAWRRGEYVLDAECFEGVKFKGSPHEVKLSYGEMIRYFRAAERNGEHLKGFITFTADSFEKPYDEVARTYCVSSYNKAFQSDKNGYSIYASCLDGTDPFVRLDNYMAVEHGGKDGWQIECCYMLCDELEHGRELVRREKEKER